MKRQRAGGRFLVVGAMLVWGVAARCIEASAPSPGCELVGAGYGRGGEVPIGVETVADGLEVPWGLAFIDETSMLVTERPGRVRLIEDGHLLPEPVATLDVSGTGEGGLLGIAVHPRFSETRTFFLYFTTQTSEGRRNQVERFTLSGDKRSATQEGTLIEGIPGADRHDGGRLRIGPDGLLYVGTGDAADRERSQDPGSLAGKVLRIDLDGRVPADNPFAGSPVYLLGVRNTQGFDWLSPGVMVVTDHGPSGEMGLFGKDEISIARAGNNLGWPRIWGCAQEAGLVTPSLTFNFAAPPGGAAMYRGTRIPQWRDSLIVATLGSKRLLRVTFDASGTNVTGYETYLEDLASRLRDVVMGPDGDLYVTTSNCDGRALCPPEKDRILRIMPR